MTIEKFMAENCVLCGTQSCVCHLGIVDKDGISNCGRYHGEIEGIPKIKSVMEILEEKMAEQNITWNDIYKKIKGE